MNNNENKSGDLYLITATFTGDDERNNKMSLNIDSFIIIPKSVEEKNIKELLEKNIPMDEGDKLSFKKVAVGQSLQFLGYVDGKSDDGTKEGDIFTYKGCKLDYVEVFEKCKQNDNSNFLFKPVELSMFPPPPDPFLNLKPSEPNQES